ncbi:metallophosphoesterase family protein [Methylobacterium oryzae CBMB20]
MKHSAHTLSGYAIYGLLLSSSDSRREVERFFRRASAEADVDGLFLMPEGHDEVLNVVDPFPVLAALADAPVEPPAVVFWTRLGSSCALPLHEAIEFFNSQLANLSLDDVRPIDDMISFESSENRARKILHISDLHFGNSCDGDVRRYVKSHLASVAETIDRVVFTGDAVDTPDIKLMAQFSEFKADIERLSGKQMITIPGNHDVRAGGLRIPIVGPPPKYKNVFLAGYSPIVVDDELECVFFCFDTCDGGNLARGRISDRQLRAISADFQERVTRSKITTFTKIALVHHHPFAYETVASTFYDRLVRKITGDEDSFTRFEGAEKFVGWCASRGVSLILHGHKHVPYHVLAEIETDRGPHEIFSVGCGSTMGAERTPLTYDVVALDRRTGRWGAKFFADRSGVGAGFAAQQISIDMRSSKIVWDL